MLTVFYSKMQFLKSRFVAMQKSTLFLLFSFISISLFSQDVTGIWRGSFSSGYGFYKQQYKYEVQVNELNGSAAQHAVQGVTYSYRSTSFYGKANLTGMFDKRSKSITIKEIKLVELRMAANSEACLMTCYLDYQKIGKTEVLSGTFSSVFVNNGGDCGTGTVYLEKVPESDFKKEDFLVKKTPPKNIPATNNENAIRLQKALGTTPDGIIGQNTLNALKNQVPGFDGQLNINDDEQINNLVTQIQKNKSKAPVIQQPERNDNAVKLQQALGTTPDGIIGPNTMKLLKKKLPGFTGQLNLQDDHMINDLVAQIRKNDAQKNTPPVIPKKENPPVNETVKSPNNNPDNPVKQTPVIPKLPVPKDLKERSNNLVKTLVTSSPDIKIELFDNGEIDGDTITVYDNNQVISFRQGLTNKPITLNVKASEFVPVHEFVMVANNLGSIPPNTALMVVTTGGKRYEVFMSADEKKNAKVVIRYEPPGK